MARIEQLDGTLLRVLREQPQSVSPLSRYANAGPVELLGVKDVGVEPDAGGSLLRRPGRVESDTDDAMIGNHCDVPLLDPLELADGHDGTMPTTIEALQVVDRHGREAWEEVLHPAVGYDPMDDQLFAPPEPTRWSRFLHRP